MTFPNKEIMFYYDLVFVYVKYKCKNISGINANETLNKVCIILNKIKYYFKERKIIEFYKQLLILLCYVNEIENKQHIININMDKNVYGRIHFIYIHLC